jgi:hypothetical protein
MILYVWYNGHSKDVQKLELLLPARMSDSYYAMSGNWPPKEAVFAHQSYSPAGNDHRGRKHQRRSPEIFDPEANSRMSNSIVYLSIIMRDLFTMFWCRAQQTLNSYDTCSLYIIAWLRRGVAVIVIAWIVHMRRHHRGCVFAEGRLWLMRSGRPNVLSWC